MPEQQKSWALTRNLLILVVVALAVAGGVANLVQSQSRLRRIRSDRLHLAEQADARRQSLEAELKDQEPGPLRDWYAALVKHHGDLEARYRRGAAIPSEPMPPDPEEPPHPSPRELMEWEEAKPRSLAPSDGR